MRAEDRHLARRQFFLGCMRLDLDASTAAEAFSLGSTTAPLRSRLSNRPAGIPEMPIIIFPRPVTSASKPSAENAENAEIPPMCVLGLEHGKIEGAGRRRGPERQWRRQANPQPLPGRRLGLSVPRLSRAAADEPARRH